MKLAFAYVRVGGFLIAVRVFWLWLAVLSFVLLSALLLDHSVAFGQERHHRQINTSKHKHKIK